MAGRIIFAVAVYIPMVILTIFLLQGKGASLLSGYNTMSQEKRAVYDMPAICRFHGWIMMSFIFFFALTHVAVLAGITWLSTIGTVFALVTLLGGRLYAHKSQRFRTNGVDTGGLYEADS